MIFINKAPIQVSDEEVMRDCKSLDDAARKCLEVSGRKMQDVAWDCGWRDEGKMLKRILSTSLKGADKRYMPSHLWLEYMVACRNLVPWQYLFLKANQRFDPDYVADVDFASELRVLRVMMGEVQDEMRAIASRSERLVQPDETMFSLSGPVGLPDWLIAEVQWKGWMVGV